MKMIEFKHRTDLLNASRICFQYQLANWEFKRLQTDAGFPEPGFYRRAIPVLSDKPQTVVYWSPSVVAAFMETLPTTNKKIAPYSWYGYRFTSVQRTRGSGNGWSKSHIVFGPQRKKIEGEQIRFLCGRKTKSVVILAGAKLLPCPSCLRLAAAREQHD